MEPLKQEDDSDEFIYDEDLLMEAARYAVSQGVQRNAFMSRSKKCWFAADAERRGAVKETLHWSRPKKRPGS